MAKGPLREVESTSSTLSQVIDHLVCGHRYSVLLKDYKHARRRHCGACNEGDAIIAGPMIQPENPKAIALEAIQKARRALRKEAYKLDNRRYGAKVIDFEDVERVLSELEMKYATP